MTLFRIASRDYWRRPEGATRVISSFFKRCPVRPCLLLRCLVAASQAARRLSDDPRPGSARRKIRSELMAVFRITLQSSPSPTARANDDAVRLRQLLKVALRSLGFKCTNVERLDDELKSNG